jgi:LYR motif-containing protein 4
MMREASRLPDFNFRAYFQRRIRDGFRSAAHLDNTAEIESRLAKARIDLAMLRRQATLGQLFDPHIRLPVEK